MSFAPIAIVGQGCVLPGALSPDELWQLVVQARVVIGPAPAGRWGIDPALVLATNSKDTRDRTLHDRGGYVQGFDKVARSNYAPLISPTPTPEATNTPPQPSGPLGISTICGQLCIGIFFLLFLIWGFSQLARRGITATPL